MLNSYIKCGFFLVVINDYRCVTHCGSSRDDKVICNIHVFLPPVVTGNYISYKFFLKNQKFQFYHTISLVSLAGHSCIMYIVGPHNRLVLFRLG